MSACPRTACKGVLAPSLRYVNGAEPLPVLCCWTCGWETDPLPCCQINQVSVGSGVLVCANCGVEVHRNTSDVRKQRRVYCSWPCYSAYKARGRETRQCPCGVAFDVPPYRRERGQRYCSRSCASAYRRREAA